MRGSLRVGVPRVAVVDGTGQRVQLLQRYPKSHPHVGGDQVPAGHAETLDNKLHKLYKLYIISKEASSHPPMIFLIMQVLAKE